MKNSDEFVRRCIETAWRGADVDGADVQDWAEELGLIVEVDGGFDPDRHHDESGCCERGDTFYEYADGLKPDEPPRDCEVMP